MTDRVLFVDDEQAVLDGLRRHFYKAYDVVTAPGPLNGMTALRDKGPFGVVVSDMRMPGMDGIQFLAEASKIAPQTVRVMLTGLSDQGTVVEAVNQGHIFRFLNKPCALDALSRVLADAVQQYHLVIAERELLEQTLRGSIKVLTDVLSLVNPTAFGRASRLRRASLAVGAVLGLGDPWQLDIAASLSQLGSLTLPEEVLAKVYSGDDLSPTEQAMVDRQAQVGHDLLAAIPRLGGVAQAILHQGQGFDGSGFPEDSRLSGLALPLEARVLKAVADLETLREAGSKPADALETMRERPGLYDPAVLDALTKGMDAGAGMVLREVTVHELGSDMVLAESIISEQGVLLVAAGQEVSESLCEMLANYLRMGRIKDRVVVRAPATAA